MDRRWRWILNGVLSKNFYKMNHLFEWVVCIHADLLREAVGGEKFHSSLCARILMARCCVQTVQLSTIPQYNKQTRHARISALFRRRSLPNADQIIAVAHLWLHDLFNDLKLNELFIFIIKNDICLVTFKCWRF